MENFSKGSHTIYHHRYHIVWITKYRYRILSGPIQIRTREILARISEELSVKIVNGIISKDHIHIFCSIPPHLSVSDYMKKMKGKSSYKLQKEFPELKKKYWGRHFWGRGYFSTTSGNITDEIINEYINNHSSYANFEKKFKNINFEGIFIIPF
jgi:putative transposase